MSFIRISHRSHSLSSLNRNRVKKKQHRKSQAPWDDSVSDLTQHRATNEEIEHRSRSHKSKHLDAVRLEKQEKQITKARASNKNLPKTDDYNSTRLLREILFDQSQLQDALSHSDRVMSVVQDLFGDDPRKHVGFPHVTLAPGQKTGQSKSRGPISELPETPSRLNILSESVMDSQALNDMEESIDDGESSYSDLEDGKENLPASFQGTLNVDRFQDFVKRQQAHQPVHPYDSAHTSLLRNTGNLKRTMNVIQPTIESLPDSLDSSRNAELDDNFTMATTAINDTVKVKKKSRSRIDKDKHKKAEEKKAKETASLSTVLKGLEQQMIDYEVATGRKSSSHDTASQLLSHDTPASSGYTSLLVQTISKLIGYLKETETRWLEEKKMREIMQYQVAEQRILIDAITADLLATQDLQLHNQQELNHHMAQNQAQLSHIQMDTFLTPTSDNADDEEYLLGQRSKATSITPISPITCEPPSMKPVIQGSSHLAKEGKTINVNLPRLDDLEISATSTPSPKAITKATDLYLQASVPKLPNRPAVQDPSNSDNMSLSLHNGQCCPSAEKIMQGRTFEQIQVEACEQKKMMDVNTKTSLAHESAHKLSSALLNATKKDSNIAQPVLTIVNSRTKKVGSHHTETQGPISSAPPRLIQDTRFTSDQHLVRDNDPLSSQFTSSYLEDKRHLGSRDTRIPFQPAILLSPPRQKDRSVNVRPRVTSVGAYPITQPDGSAIGTVHSIQSGSQQVHAYQPAITIANKPLHQQQSFSKTLMYTTAGSMIPGQSDVDLSARIAQLSRQHDEAKIKLQQLKSSREETADRRKNNGVLTSNDTFKRNAELCNPGTIEPLNGPNQPVSPPISPITCEPPSMKPVIQGSSHLAKEGKTINVNIPRLDDLEISATSTPSPKTTTHKPSLRHDNRPQWQAPDKHDENTQEEQFFALTAHVAT